ncbi:hypothetical protein [Streptomyces sp. A012304]|uniref:hypothetical protein n=1 Tax=Streptomyces sp. A012304 TaxID=375446 RepID=UPI0022307763|nr:hypothetical protein [Streptomyces sp. A012304]GKQ40554.1 hypothetical protein ALMP_70770 [Streptomyces sp. A012304]
MSDTSTEPDGVTSQYAAQVAGDLERNLKEQERISGEIATLQQQLAALEKDRSVLLNVRQALGVEPPQTAPAAEPVTPAAEPVASVPAPRKKTAAAAGTAKQTKAKKAAPAARKPADKKKATRTASMEPAQPSLVSLVREHLAGQSEPRSAAEVAQSLGQQYPERGIKATVVRTTLEGLVAKNHAQRTKQGTSVFYTAPDAQPPAEEQKQEPSA